MSFQLRAVVFRHFDLWHCRTCLRLLWLLDLRGLRWLWCGLGAWLLWLLGVRGDLGCWLGASPTQGKELVVVECTAREIIVLPRLRCLSVTFQLNLAISTCSTWNVDYQRVPPSFRSILAEVACFISFVLCYDRVSAGQCPYLSSDLPFFATNGSCILAT